MTVLEKFVPSSCLSAASKNQLQVLFDRAKSEVYACAFREPGELSDSTCVEVMLRAFQKCIFSIEIYTADFALLQCITKLVLYPFVTSWISIFVFCFPYSYTTHLRTYTIAFLLRPTFNFSDYHWSKFHGTLALSAV